MKGEHRFVDTNILVYAHDLNGGVKREVARTLIREMWTQPYPAAVSTQVLQELYVNLVRKGVALDVAGKVVESYYAWEVITIDTILLSQAFDLQIRCKTSFWDALILVAAKRAGAQILLSEDLNSGQRYDGVLVKNPFAP